MIPLKAGLPTEKYGGYNKAGVMFFIPVQYKGWEKVDLNGIVGGTFIWQEISGRHDICQRVCERSFTAHYGKARGYCGFPNGNATMEGKYHIVFRWIPRVYHGKCEWMVSV